MTSAKISCFYFFKLLLLEKVRKTGNTYLFIGGAAASSFEKKHMAFLHE